MKVLARVDAMVMEYLCTQAERLGYRLGEATVLLVKQEVRAMAKAVEVRLAEALLEVEPEKVEGGSHARREWLRAVMSVMLLLRVVDRDAEAFRSAVSREPLTDRKKSNALEDQR